MVHAKHRARGHVDQNIGLGAILLGNDLDHVDRLAALLLDRDIGHLAGQRLKRGLRGLFLA